MSMQKFIDWAEGLPRPVYYILVALLGNLGAWIVVGIIYLLVRLMQWI